MKLGLVAKKFRNNDINFNIHQIVTTAEIYQNKDIDFLCFGEAFLQGFDGFTWNSENDEKRALTKNAVINKLKLVAKNNHVGLAIGYLEKDKTLYYSSYLFIDNNGNEIYNYRRYTRGWKEHYSDARIYQEGNEIGLFKYKNKIIAVGLCGDFWDNDYDYVKRISMIKKDVVIWPVYVDYSLIDWKNELTAYAKQSSLFGDRVVLINSLCENPISHGGCFDFYKGKLLKKIAFDKEAVLLVKI